MEEDRVGDIAIQVEGRYLDSPLFGCVYSLTSVSGIDSGFRPVPKKCSVPVVALHREPSTSRVVFCGPPLSCSVGCCVGMFGILVCESGVEFCVDARLHDETVNQLTLEVGWVGGWMGRGTKTLQHLPSHKIKVTFYLRFFTSNRCRD